MKPSLMKLTYFAAIVLLASCSIKEDRSGCPCYLILDVDNFVDGGFSRGGAVAFSGQGLDFAGRVDLEACYGCGYVRAVPRVPIDLACAAGIHTCSFEGAKVMVKPGSQADSIMSFACKVVPDADELVVKAVPHKQFCVLHMIAEPPEEYASNNVMITGRYAGLDLLVLSPVEGGMESPGRHCEDGSFEARLLRQADDAGLEVVMLSGSGEVLYNIDLTQALKDASYDWGKEDLDDVTMRVDYAKAVVSIEISEWDSDENYRNVEI